MKTTYLNSKNLSTFPIACSEIHHVSKLVWSQFSANSSKRMLFIVRLTQQYDVRLSYVQLTKLHVSTPWGHIQAYKI